jgi:hypothetical protein
VRTAKGFYAVYAALIGLAAGIVLIPGSPLGLLTEGVQALAGVLLPSASVYLLLLCNDREVLGPWVNGRKTNAFTGSVVAVLVALSVILTASVLFPSISARQILDIMIACGAAGVLGAGYVLSRRLRTAETADPVDRSGRENWRMPPLHLLQRPAMATSRKLGIGALRIYLSVATVLVIVKIAELMLGH